MTSTHADKKTRVALVVFGDISAIDGLTIRVRRVAEILARRYALTVITCSSNGEEKHGTLAGAQSIKVRNPAVGLLSSRETPIVFKLLPIAIWNIKLAFVLLTNKFDVVYCANDMLGFPGVLIISRLKRNKVIFETHAVLSEESKEIGNAGIRLRLDEFLEEFVMTNADCVIALSQNGYEFYRRFTKKIDTVPVFVDTDLFRIGTKSARRERKQVGLVGPFDAPSGRQRSGLEFLLRNIPNFDSRIDFTVIGSCENRVENERITYTGFLDSAGDYVNRLSSLDAVLVAEGFATYGPLNKILEPMACAVPVFTNPKGVVGLSWVELGKDLFVFDEAEIVEKINELIFNDSLMKNVGDNARKVVEQYYSKKENEQKLFRIIEAVVKGTPLGS